MSGHRTRRSLGPIPGRLIPQLTSETSFSPSTQAGAGGPPFSMTNRYDFPLGASLATDPSPTSPSFSDLASRATNEVLDSLSSDRPVAFSYLLFRRRNHKELSVAVSVDQNRASAQLPTHRPPARRNLGNICIKFDSRSGRWCLARHGRTKTYNRPPAGLSAMESASQCGCATVSPWEKRWKLLLQFEGLKEEGPRGGLHTIPAGDVVGAEGTLLMKVSADGAMGRVDGDDVPANLRFMWLSGRPTVILNGFEQKRMPRTLNLSDVEVMQCAIDAGRLAGEDLTRCASETSSGHPTPEQVFCELASVVETPDRGHGGIAASLK